MSRKNYLIFFSVKDIMILAEERISLSAFTTRTSNPRKLDSELHVTQEKKICHWRHGNSQTPLLMSDAGR